MYIFDNVLLSQYLDVGAEVKVYSNSEWYFLSDKRDVSDSIDVIAYDEWGGDHRFSYQTIEQIMVDGKIITLDMLASRMGDKSSDTGNSDKPKKDKEPDLGDEAPSEDKPEKEKKGKGPDLSWFSPVYKIGRIIMKEKEERKKNSGSKI